MKFEPRIIEATIGPMPKGLFDPMPKLTVVFDDGSQKELFSFYPDEIFFRREEFIGLTEREAFELKRRKDKLYLQS